jgi:hypothetical protein
VKNFTAARNGKMQRCANRWNLSLQNGNNDKTRDITWVAKQISFDHVDFRDYRRIAGDNPSVTDGCKLAIRWEYNCHLPFTSMWSPCSYCFVHLFVRNRGCFKGSKSRRPPLPCRSDSDPKLNLGRPLERFGHPVDWIIAI